MKYGHSLSREQFKSESATILDPHGLVVGWSVSAVSGRIIITKPFKFGMFSQGSFYGYFFTDGRYEIGHVEPDQTEFVSCSDRFEHWAHVIRFLAHVGVGARVAEQAVQQSGMFSLGGGVPIRLDGQLFVEDKRFSPNLIQVRSARCSWINLQPSDYKRITQSQLEAGILAAQGITGTVAHHV